MSFDHSVWNSVQNGEYDWAEPEVAQAIDEESQSSSSFGSYFPHAQSEIAVGPLAPEPAVGSSAVMPPLFNEF